jgi:hypothetical protein
MSESDLEGQFELEMEDPIDSAREGEQDLETPADLEGEQDLETPADLEGEQDLETPADLEGEQDLENQFEQVREEYEEPFSETQSPIDNLAEKFFELSESNISDNEADSAVNGLLNEVERDFFFGKLLKKGLGKKLFSIGKGLVKGLPVFQGLKGITQLARGDLKGMLGSLAKTGLASVIPGGSAALPILNSLGLSEISENSENSLDRWKDFVRLSEISYEYLAQNLDANSMKNPIAASRLASNAFQTAATMVRNRNRGSPYPSRRSGSPYPSRRSSYPRGKSYKLHIRPGDIVKLRILGK